jgi:tetratricopeptide (TPR) repeat protein
MTKAFATLLLLAACQSSMREPPPLRTLAPKVTQQRSADELVAAANTAWSQRGEAGEAAAAQDAYLAAAALDQHRTDALLGAMQAIHYRVEYENGIAKGTLTDEAVEIGQWCTRLSPHDPACMYRLAIALGQEAREHPLRARDAVKNMLALLHDAIAIDASIDGNGPHRVLALVLVRAPSWPGPGDAEQALVEARAAVAGSPDVAENQLALAEALAANDSSAEARDAYRRAAQLAESIAEPEGATWRAQAHAGLVATN